MNNKFDKFIILIYLGLIAWLGYRLFKSNKSKKNLEGQIKSFGKKTTTMEYILFGLLILTGAVNLYQGINTKNQTALITASVMIVMGFVFFLNTKTKIYIAENGILLNDSFFTYKQLKKWGFDKERGNLVILTKKDHQDSQESTQVKKEDINEINSLIRKYKLGK